MIHLAEEDKSEVERLAREYRRRWLYMAAAICMAALWFGAMAYPKLADAKRMARAMGVGQPSLSEPLIPVKDKVGASESRMLGIQIVETQAVQAMGHTLLSLLWLISGLTHFRVASASRWVERQNRLGNVRGEGPDLPAGTL